MPIFEYKAVSPTGETVQGTMEAGSMDRVISRLQEAGNIPLQAQEAGKGGFSLAMLRSGRRGIGSREVGEFTQQLATLLGAGLPLDRSLQVLLELTEMGLPAGSEFLDTISPQFIADLISWGAIGARTTESQIHRELSSGLSMPVGFKNGTDGTVQIAIDAIGAARHPHHFLSVTKQGISAIVATAGNDSCHVILRGGNSGPNYAEADVEAAAAQLEKAGLPHRVMVDCSHGNSSKDHARQPLVAEDVAAQVSAGSDRIFGVMLESHLVEGRQDQKPDQALVYGQSITDACISWDTTVEVLEKLAEAVRARRARG